MKCFAKHMDETKNPNQSPYITVMKDKYDTMKKLVDCH